MAEIKVRATSDELAAVAKALAKHHSLLRREEPRLIIRHKVSDDRNVHLFEVFGNSPGGQTEEFDRYEFPPSLDLMIRGQYYFTIINPAQLQHALQHGNPSLMAIAREADALGDLADTKMLLFSRTRTDKALWNRIKTSSDHAVRH
jgi:hypothetical protein